MSDITLAQEYDSLSNKSRLAFDKVPSHIELNLNPKFKLRPYQKEAVYRWLDYYQDKELETKNHHLLFNMATGSGKTIIMASFILDLYQKGYRNFIFFVDKTNIVEKTRDNFLNPTSSKYLFNNKINIEGKNVNIVEVNNFEAVSKEDVNILFTTISGLHTRLNNPAENSVTYQDLEKHKIVMLSDEAHHINSLTKSSKSKEEQKEETSWEYTVNRVHKSNKENILLEFTATIDTTHPAIAYKYSNKILYKYDLKAFRQDGYSKDVLVYSVSEKHIERALQALIISQYRKKMALNNDIYLKPVILFKSKTIKESKEFYEGFDQKIKNLKSKDISVFKDNAKDVLSKAFEYFKKHNILLENLVLELKTDFIQENCLLVDSQNIAPKNQLLLNSLEDRDNNIRAIFAVDMLNEGWDVLNLFDIVRLYDTRDTKNNKVGKTTTAEAQLIGRGARYYPFGSEESKYIRKYDNDLEQELRVIEQLHYHSAHNPKYIQEITIALKETGIMPSEFTELDLLLKPSFKKTSLYSNGVVWVNERREKNKGSILENISSPTSVPSNTTLDIELPSKYTQVINVFDGKNLVKEKQKKKTVFVKITDFNKHIIQKALNTEVFYDFSNLKKHFYSLKSTTEFIESNNYLGAFTLQLTHSLKSLEEISNEQSLYLLKQALKQIKNKIIESETMYEGTETFTPKPIQEVIKDKLTLKIVTSDSTDKEYGRSQMQSSKYYEDILGLDWYVYSDNYGTSEEKSLVKTLNAMMQELEKKWSDIYLIRNEKFFKLYSFNKGLAFEPDFVMFANDKSKGNVSWQVFIEPKGKHLIKNDLWKQEFLLDLERKFKNSTVLYKNIDFKVISLPFYTEELNKVEIVNKLKDL